MGTRILIVRLGAIGDVIHTLPSLSAIRAGITDCSVGWVVQKGVVYSLLEDCTDIQELYGVDLSSPSGISEAVRTIRDAAFDLSLDFQGLLKSAMIPWLARIPRRVGFSFAALREPASGLLLTDRVEADDTTHIIEKNLTLARFLGVNSAAPYNFPIADSAADREFAKKTRDLAGGNYAILNPGGGWQTKLWEAERYGLIADRLWREFGVRSLVTFGPEEGNLASRVTESARTGAAVPVSSTLKQFFALSRGALLFVGPDTGPMHIAAAAGTPIVSLIGSSSARRNGPFDARDMVVERDDLECRVDCYRRRCEHTSCMDLPVEAVWAAITRRLATLESPQAGAAELRNWEVSD